MLRNNTILYGTPSYKYPHNDEERGTLQEYQSYTLPTHYQLLSFMFSSRPLSITFGSLPQLGEPISIATIPPSSVLLLLYVVSTIGAMSVKDVASQSHSGTQTDQTNHSNNLIDQVNFFVSLDTFIPPIPSISTSLSTNDSSWFIILK